MSVFCPYGVRDSRKYLISSAHLSGSCPRASRCVPTCSILRRRPRRSRHRALQTPSVAVVLGGLVLSSQVVTASRRRDPPPYGGWASWPRTPAFDARQCLRRELGGARHETHKQLPGQVALQVVGPAGHDELSDDVAGVEGQYDV